MNDTEKYEYKKTSVKSIVERGFTVIFLEREEQNEPVMICERQNEYITGKSLKLCLNKPFKYH